MRLMEEKTSFKKPVLMLLLITPLLTELLSTNIAFPDILNPLIFLPLIVVYGFCALLIREASISWKLGLIGLFVLGLAYGIYNEGICAKTLLMHTDMPMEESYGHYGLVFGINLAWASFILIWHALHSVLYPLLIISCFYPRAQGKRWLSNRQIALALMLIALLGIVMFGAEFQAPFVFLPLFCVVIAILALLSAHMPKDPSFDYERRIKSVKPALLGISFFVPFMFVQVSLANAMVPLVGLYMAGILILGLYYAILKRNKWLAVQPLALFALGHYLADAIFGWFIGLYASPSLLFTHTIFVAALVMAIKKARG